MADQNQNRDVTAKSIIATLIGFFLLSLDSVLVKLEEKGGATIEWIVFIQYSTCLIIITIIAAKNKFRDLKTTKIKLHLLRGVTGVLAFSCYVIAVTKIPLVNATLLNNTAPIFIPVVTLIWLKTSIDKKIWWGISVGFIGIIFILNPSKSMLLQTGDIYALSAGIFLAIAYVSLKVLTKTETFVTVLFYYSSIAFILSLPFAINNWSNPNLLIWIYGVLTGILFISYLYLLQYAYQFVEAVKLSPFNYSAIVFTGILDWMIFDHVPEVTAIIGIILVSAGGILAITLHEKHNEKLKHHWHW